MSDLNDYITRILPLDTVVDELDIQSMLFVRHRLACPRTEISAVLDALVDQQKAWIYTTEDHLHFYSGALQNDQILLSAYMLDEIYSQAPMMLANREDDHLVVGRNDYDNFCYFMGQADSKGAWFDTTIPDPQTSGIYTVTVEGRPSFKSFFDVEWSTMTIPIGAYYQITPDHLQDKD